MKNIGIIVRRFDYESGSPCEILGICLSIEGLKKFLLSKGREENSWTDEIVCNKGLSWISEDTIFDCQVFKYHIDGYYNELIDCTFKSEDFYYIINLIDIYE